MYANIFQDADFFDNVEERWVAFALAANRYVLCKSCSESVLIGTQLKFMF